MQGLVMRSTGSWYEVLGEDHILLRCRLRGKLKLAEKKLTNPIAVGDWVRYDWEDQAAGTGLIDEVMPRENYIIRKSVHKTAHAHVLAANIDQAIIIATLTFPRTSMGFVDRFLVSAESFRIPAKIIFNKIDLLIEEEIAYLREELCPLYESLGYPCLLSSTLTGEGIDIWKTWLSDKKTLLSGHSGVGKSSLVNTIAPTLDLRVGEVSTFANKGKHTTTFAEMFEIAPQSFIIDTPGIKELGLIDIEREELSHFFPEMRALMGKCRYHNCIHLEEPACAVREAAEKGSIHPSRYLSYLSMMENDDNRR